MLQPWFAKFLNEIHKTSTEYRTCVAEFASKCATCCVQCISATPACNPVGLSFNETSMAVHVRYTPCCIVGISISIGGIDRRSIAGDLLGSSDAILRRCRERLGAIARRPGAIAPHRRRQPVMKRSHNGSVSSMRTSAGMSKRISRAGGPRSR